MIKELKRVKGIFKTHYQTKDVKKALDMFEEKNLYITNLNGDAHSIELKAAYCEIIYENLKVIKDMFQILDPRLKSFASSKGNLRDRLNRLSSFYLNCLVKYLDFEDNEYGQRLKDLHQEITVELNQLLSIII